MTLVARRRRPLGRRRVGQLSEVVMVLFERQRDVAASLEAEWRELERRTSVSSEVDRRLAAVEADLAYVANELVPRRKYRVAVLRRQVNLLQARAGEHKTAPTSGTLARPALIYAAALVLVWLVLWQLALAAGFR
jgi:hypothetical protein